jgi:HEAT repeat protein
MLIWLRCSDIKQRRTAPIILGDLGPLAAVGRPELLEASNDQDKWVRRHATQALKKIDAGAPKKHAIKEPLQQ